MNSAGKPAVAVNAAIAHDLEILGLVSALGLGILEGIKHAHAFNRSLDGAVDALWFGQTRGFEHSGSNINDMVPLRTNLVGGFDPLRPRDDHAIACAAIVRRNLLSPHERRITRDGPARGHVRKSRRSAPLVVMLEHLLHRLRNAIEIGKLVEHAQHAALGAGAVVADDVEDQRVIELAYLANGIEQPADLVVAIFSKGGINFHLAGKELLLVGA